MHRPKYKYDFVLIRMNRYDKHDFQLFRASQSKSTDYADNGIEHTRITKRYILPMRNITHHSTGSEVDPLYGSIQSVMGSSGLFLGKRIVTFSSCINTETQCRVRMFHPRL